MQRTSSNAGKCCRGRRSCVARSVCCEIAAVACRNVAMTIKIQEQFNILCALLLLSSLVLLSCATAQAQKKSKYACDEAQPESMCNAANTCGSPLSPCTIDISRSAS